jgi:glycosidase
VGAVWLSPIYKSPMKDFGYDIQDFREIAPVYGTMDDFHSLSKAMKERGKPESVECNVTSLKL